MRKVIGIFAKGLGYGLYILVLFLVLVIIRFPRESFNSWVTMKVKKVLSDDILLDSPAFAPPWGIKVKSLRVQKNVGERQVDLLVLDQIELSPKFRSILSGIATISLKGRGYGGEIGGEIKAALLRPQNAEVHLEFKQLDLQKYTPSSTLLPVSLFGNVDGVLDLNLSRNVKDPPKGQMTFTVVKGKIDGIKILNQPIPSLDYDDIIGKATFTLPNVTLETFEVKSKDLNFLAEGTIELADPFTLSPINLEVKFRPSRSIDRTLAGILTLLNTKRDSRGYSVLKLKGTVVRPELAL